MKRSVIVCFALAFCSAGLAYAKLPPPSEEEKAKAIAAKAKAAEEAKKEAAALARAQDRVVEIYKREKRLIASTGAAAVGDAAKTTKKSRAAKALRAPSMEKFSCRTGPNDEQVRLIAQVVKSRPMEFAYYSRLGTSVCSIHGRRGDAYTKWVDKEGGKTAVRLLAGSAQLEYKPGHFLVKFSEVDRMRYCGMDGGELNGSVAVSKRKSECVLVGVFD